MTLVLPTASTSTAAPVDAAVVWRFDPWREHPRRAALAAACALGLCLLVLALRLPFLLAAALSIACVGAFSPALAPVECRLEASGPARRGPFGWERRGWQDVRRIEALPVGVLLSPFGRRHRLDATRGLVLPMPAGRRAELSAAVERWRETHGG